MAGRSGGTTRPNGAAVTNKICQFKLVLLGESAVGKSSLVLRFVKGQFHEFQESTIGGSKHIMFYAFKPIVRQHVWYNVSGTFIEGVFRHLKGGREFMVLLFLLSVPQPPSSLRLCVWMTPRWSLRFGTRQARSATTAWRRCTTEVPRQPSWCMTSPTRYSSPARQ